MLDSRGTCDSTRPVNRKLSVNTGNFLLPGASRPIQGCRFSLMNHFYYFAYGLFIRSVIGCPSLQRVSPLAGTVPDVDLLLGSVPESLDKPLTRGVLFEATGDEYLLKIPGVGKFLVRNGNEIVIETSNETECSWLIVGTPLAALLQQRGLLVLHASVVETEFGAIAFAGNSGVGKSTIAAGMMERGYGQLLADELCVVEKCPDSRQAYVWPGSIEVLLWRNALDMLDWEAGNCRMVRTGLQRYARASMRPGEPQNSVPLLGVYVITVRSVRDPVVDTIRGSRKASVLLEQQFNQQTFLQLYSKKAVIPEIASVAQDLPMRCVTNPGAAQSFFKLVDMIHQDARGLHVYAAGIAPSVGGSGTVTRNAKPLSLFKNLTPGAPDKQLMRNTRVWHKNLVWMASYPKSGNTWLRAFLANYLSDSEKPYDINALAEDRATGLIASQRKLFDELAGVEASSLSELEIASIRPSVYERLSQIEASRSGSVLYIKIHDALTRFTAAEFNLVPDRCTRGVILVVRNPLDVVISYAHHFNLTLDQSIEVLNSDTHISAAEHALESQLKQTLLSWSGHYNSWANASGFPVMVVRYEDMKNSPQATFREVVEFSGLPVDESRLEMAIKNSGFDVLKNQERETGFAENPSSSRFFRKGTVGGWSDMLLPSQANLIVKAHEQVMSKLGYC